MAITNPSDITGLVADWNADSLALADGAAVTSWTDDQSSLVLATPDTDGVYDDGADWPHGHASVVMTDARLTVTASALSLATPCYVFIAEPYLDDGDWLFNKAATSPATFALRKDSVADDGLNAMLRDTGAAVHEAVTGLLTPEAQRLIVQQYDGTTHSLRLDNELSASHTPAVTMDTTPDGALAIGGHPTVNTANAVHLRLFRVLVYNHALNTTELADITDWYNTNYGKRYTRQASGTGITPNNVSSASAYDDGTTLHIFACDEANDEFDYYTAPSNDPTNWTLNTAAAYTPTAATRGMCLTKEGSTWYLIYDDRTNGHIEYASGTSPTTLTHQARLFTGAAGKFYRHPSFLPPSETHDGNWRGLIDIRTDAVFGGIGHVIAVSGASLAALTENGTVLSPSGAGWDATDVGAASVRYVNGTYEAVAAGYNDAETYTNYAPHSIGRWSSTDFATWTEYPDNPVLDARCVPGTFDCQVVGEPELLPDLSMFYSGHNDSVPRISSVGYATVAAAGQTIEASVSFGTSQGISAASNAILEATATFGAAQSAAAGGDAVLNAAQAIGIQQGFSVDCIATLSATVAFGINAAFLNDGAIATGPQTIEAALTVGIVQGVEAISVANLYAATTLGSQVALTTAGGTNIEGAVAFGIQQSHVQSVDISIEGAVAYGVQQAIATSAQADLQASATLGHQVALQAIANAVLNAGLSLSAIQSVTTSGFTLIVGLTTPDGRTITIRAEDRTITIQ